MATIIIYNSDGTLGLEYCVYQDCIPEQAVYQRFGDDQSYLVGKVLSKKDVVNIIFMRINLLRVKLMATEASTVAATDQSEAAQLARAMTKMAQMVGIGVDDPNKECQIDNEDVATTSAINFLNLAREMKHSDKVKFRLRSNDQS